MDAVALNPLTVAVRLNVVVVLRTGAVNGTVAVPLVKESDVGNIKPLVVAVPVQVTVADPFGIAPAGVTLKAPDPMAPLLTGVGNVNEGFTTLTVIGAEALNPLTVAVR